MAKRKVVWSSEARRDLIDILKYYIKQNGNAEYSIKLNTKINKNVSFLVQNPYLGTKTDYESVRAFVLENIISSMKYLNILY